SDPPGAAAQLPADRQHAQALVAELEDGFVSGPLGSPSTEGLSLYPGPRQAAHDAFLDHDAFEFGKHATHLQQCPAGWCRAVDVLLVQVHIDAEGLKFSEQLDQVLQAPA